MDRSSTSSSVKQHDGSEKARDWSEGRSAAASAQHDGGDGGNGAAMAPASRKGSPSPPQPGGRSSFSDRVDPSDIPGEPHGHGNHHTASISPAEQHTSRRQTRESAGPEPNGIGGGADPEAGTAAIDEVDLPTSSVEKDAAHFKMVAARFRALMERRERRLEEAMSDPQTRTDLEAMFPGIKEGDYQTLLAGVRGMEEDDFQALLAAARKRRREVGARFGGQG